MVPMTDLNQKYRPSTLSEVVGQDRAVRQLKEYVKRGDCPPSLLFSGPSGTGKTSAARAFARAMNCLDPKDGDACAACAWCEERPANVDVCLRKVDVTNMGGVEGIRQMRDESRHYHPFSKWWFYILDEAHELATGLQQDALLEPLEEPGLDSRWILVTTSPEKLNKPIRTRTTEITFGPVDEAEIEARLVYVSRSEGGEVDANEIARIAQRSEGSPRVAMKLLDELLLGLPPSDTEDRSTLATRLVTSALDGDCASAPDLASMIAEGRNASSVAGMFDAIVDDVFDILRGREPTLVRLRGRQHLAALEDLERTSLKPLREALRTVTS